MESTSLPATAPVPATASPVTASPVTAAVDAGPPVAPVSEQPGPAVPALIFLESADGAGVCDVDGVCN
jgi:hypothetical protein